jgi:metallophosphoesterase superfamily enzyme
MGSGMMKMKMKTRMRMMNNSEVINQLEIKHLVIVLDEFSELKKKLENEPKRAEILEVLKKYSEIVYKS